MTTSTRFLGTTGSLRLGNFSSASPITRLIAPAPHGAARVDLLVARPPHSDSDTFNLNTRLVARLASVATAARLRPPNRGDIGGPGRRGPGAAGRGGGRRRGRARRRRERG